MLIEHKGGKNMLKDTLFKGDNSFFSDELTALDVYSNYFTSMGNELLVSFRFTRASGDIHEKEIRVMWVKGDRIPIELVKEYVAEVVEKITEAITPINWYNVVDLDKILQETLNGMPKLLDYKKE